MLAPNALLATSWPSALNAAVISRVVVVLPLVPVTRTIWRPAASSLSSSGSTRRPSTPPMTDPSPRPVSCETRPAAPPIPVARRARSGSLLMGADVIRCYPETRPGSRTAMATAWSSAPTMNRLGHDSTGSSQPAMPISPAALLSCPR